jgi:hypothetical protein
MSPIRTLVVLALVPSLASASVTLDKAGKGSKKGDRHVRGKVVAVQKDSGKDTGTITVQVHQGKKKKTAANGGTAPPPVEKTFKVTASTKFQVFQGKKGAVQQKDSSFGELQKGATVLILHNGDEATDVKVVTKKKGKKTL